MQDIEAIVKKAIEIQREFHVTEYKSVRDSEVQSCLHLD